MITLWFGALIRFNHIPNGIVGVGHEHPKFIEAHPFGGGDVFSGLWVGCLLLGGMHVEPMGFFQHHLPCQLIGVECGWQFTGDVQVGNPAFFMNLAVGRGFGRLIFFCFSLGQIIYTQPFNCQKLIFVVGDQPTRCLQINKLLFEQFK